MALYGLSDQQVEVVLQLMAEYIETLHKEVVAETKRMMELAVMEVDKDKLPN